MDWVPWALVAALLGGLVTLGILLRRARSRLRTVEDGLAELSRQPAVISHEIRTPLALVRGAAELLAEGTPGPLTPIQSKFVNTISENTQVVIDMAENMLTTAKLEAGTFRPAMDLVDISEVVSRCAREVRRVLRTKIRVEAAGGMLPAVTDENLVRQLVWNLVNNAARHAGDSASITISVREDPGGMCMLAVSDNGQGMSEEERGRLFVPFSTGHGQRPGSGLGMMVVKRITEVLGGTVLVDTEQGAGTSIVVVIPIREGATIR
ncbi:MAG: sensor histidine kinase [Galactobacter sp.]